MITKLVKLANHLDEKGFTKEADYLDAIIKSAATDKSMGEALAQYLAQTEGKNKSDAEKRKIMEEVAKKMGLNATQKGKFKANIVNMQDVKNIAAKM